MSYPVIGLYLFPESCNFVLKSDSHVPIFPFDPPPENTIGFTKGILMLSRGIKRNIKDKSVKAAQNSYSHLPETFDPINTAPANSKMLAIIQACNKVNTLAPTDVPNEFATSFAPIPNANIKANINPRISSHKTFSCSGTNIIWKCTTSDMSVTFLSLSNPLTVSSTCIEING